MKNKIEDSFTEKKLDSFLKNNYGYGIWEFASSLQLIYDLYDEKKRHIVHQYIGKQLNRLKKIKENIMKQLNDFLTEADFSGFTEKLGPTKKTRWPRSKKRDFVKNAYKLNQFHSIVDEQIKKYKEYYSLLKPILNKTMKEFPYVPTLPRRLKPLELLVLTWSYTMRKEGKKNWTNMANLLSWFVKRLKDNGIRDIFRLEEFETPLPELFQLYWNRYKESDYSFFALIIFDLTFRQKKEKVPKPINVLKELSQMLKGDAEELKKMIDNAVLWELITPA